MININKDDLKFDIIFIDINKKLNFYKLPYTSIDKYYPKFIN